jgi:integrase
MLLGSTQALSPAPERRLIMAKQLVRLRARPSRDGSSFTYLIDFADKNGKRRQISLGHADKKKADRQLAQKERELRMGIVELDRVKLRELLADYLEQTRTQIEPSTSYSAAYRMQDMIDAVGNKYADEVTYRDCEKFQQYCIDKPLAPASANTHIKMVKRIFSLAVKRGQLDNNPFDGLPLLKIPRKSIRLLSAEEYEKVIRCAPSPIWRARLMLAKTAGLRRGEALNLTINDIDFAKGKIIVQAKSVTKHTWRWVVKDKDRRELPLIDKAAQLLIDIQTGLPEGQPYLLLTPQRYRYLIKLSNAGKLLDRISKCPASNFRRYWKCICMKAGIEDITFQDLRATCITEWLEKGMMPHEVQRLAGHSSIDTTMNYYVGIRESMIDRAREASSVKSDGNFVARLLRAPQNTQKVEGKELVAAMQTLIEAGVIKIGATGLEPATS